MKKRIKQFSIVLLLTFFMGINLTVLAQGPPPPPGGGHGLDSNQPANGGDAPIGGGIAILLTLVAAWGGRKVYQAYKPREKFL